MRSLIAGLLAVLAALTFAITSQGQEPAAPVPTPTATPQPVVPAPTAKPKPKKVVTLKKYRKVTRAIFKASNVNGDFRARPRSPARWRSG